MAECRARPRDMAAIREELADLLEAFPELAEDAIYSKPVGKDRETGEEKFAEGLSIRAAEALASYVIEPTPERILPDPLDKQVALRIGRAVAAAARETGVCR